MSGKIGGDVFRLGALPLPVRPHISTIHRWVRRGVRGHKLATILIGGIRFVRREDLDAFLAALNGEQVREQADDAARDAGAALAAAGA